MSIDALVDRMQSFLVGMQADDDPRRFFHATYLRTTLAVRDELRARRFRDNEWVERWDVVFADLYLDALTADQRGEAVARPWAVAFTTTPLPPLRHVLLGMNAHINFDLPQALVAVIPSEDFDDQAVMRSRQADHRHLDEVLAARVSAEDDELARVGGTSLTDRILRPLNRRGTMRFLRESREKVWGNALVLDRARRRGPDAYARALGELEALSARRVTQLNARGPVLLNLAVRGFGVRLAPLPGPA